MITQLIDLQLSVTAANAIVAQLEAATTTPTANLEIDGIQYTVLAVQVNTERIYPTA